MANLPRLLFQLLSIMAAAGLIGAQTSPPQSPVPITRSAGAPLGGDLSLDNFEYQYGNTAGLAGPNVKSSGLTKGQVAGIATGCVLGGLLFGALGMMCWLKRRRLFPSKYGPCKHPGEAPPVSMIDVLRTGSKLDSMTKTELQSVKSFTSRTDVPRGHLENKASLMEAGRGAPPAAAAAAGGY